MVFDWIIGAIAAITLGYLYLTWNYDYWKKRGICYVQPKLLFGNYKDVVMIKKSVGTVMHEIYKKMEGQPFVGLFRFRTPALLVRDPEIVRTVLIKEFPSFGKNAIQVNSEMDPLFAKSPFFSSGEQWKYMRSVLSPTFTSGKLKPLFPLIEKCAKDLDEYLKINDPKSEPDGIEVKELCCKFTTDVVASCVFGIESGCLKNDHSEFREMNRKMLNQDFLTNVRILFTTFFPSLGAILKIRLMPLYVANFYRRIVKEVMMYRQENNETRSDFLQILMQIRQKAQAIFEQQKSSDEGPEYTDEDVTSHAVTFVTEGFETSSITMSFLLYELAMNPDIQNRLREEIIDAVQKNNGKLSNDIILNLPYLNLAFTESLRMHPPLMTMEKFCTMPCELPTESGCTFQVEPGTLVLIPVHAIHRDPKYYPEPDRFDPERFSEERKESIPKYTYLPFGEGPRICIGIRFAQLQVKTGVAQILLNYDIRPSAKTPKTIVQNEKYFLADAKGGLWLNFVRRS